MKLPIPPFSALALAIGLLMSVSAMAQTMSYGDYQSGKSKIKTEYKAEKKSCDSLAGNAKDVCVKQAKGKEEVAQAELYDSYKPSPKAHYKVQVAKAEATYDVAKERCDDLAGNPKDVCRKEAKAALTTAKANARVAMTTQADNATANQKSAAAQNQASKQNAAVRSDAAADKRAAQFQVEKEKCDAFASTAKDNCLKAAQANFGKL